MKDKYNNIRGRMLCMSCRAVLWGAFSSFTNVDFKRALEDNCARSALNPLSYYKPPSAESYSL